VEPEGSAPFGVLGLAIRTSARRPRPACSTDTRPVRSV